MRSVSCWSSRDVLRTWSTWHQECNCTVIFNLDWTSTKLCPCAFSCGILLVYVMGWAMHWKWVAAAAAITTTTISLFVFFVVPESPAWLFHRGDTAASREFWTCFVFRFETQFKVILDYFVPRTSLSLLRNVHITVVEPEIRHLEEAASKQKDTAHSKGNYSSMWQYLRRAWNVSTILFSTVNR